MNYRSNNRIPSTHRGKISWVASAAVLLALLANLPLACAEFFQNSTTTTILNGYIPPSSVITANSTAAAKLTTPGGVGITFVGLASASPGDNTDGTGTGSDIVFANIAISGLTNTSALETILIPYTFHIVIDDYATFSSLGALGSATFDITGQLTGTVGKLGGGKQVNLTTNTYSPGNVLSKVIGGEIYTLSFFSYVPPGPSFAGAFGVHVTATAVPEPGSLALLGLGSLALVVPAARRKWRKQPAVC